jgi:putative MATE family efflux protein
MWISLFGAVVNGVLNPILIFGWGTLEGMGMAGSAWASLVAQMVMLGTAIHLMLKNTPFSLIPRTWRHPELKALWLLSGNLFGRTIALNVCYYLGNRYATGYGLSYIGAHSIAMQIWLFSAFFIDGYASAGSVLVGRLNGEGNFKEMYRVVWQVVRMSVTIGSALAVIYLALYNVIGTFFTPDPEVLLLLSGIFWMVVFTQPINAVAFTFDGVYKGLGNGRLLRDTLFLSTFIIFVPVAWGTDALGWQLYAVWSAFLLWMIARGTLLALHFRRNYGPGSPMHGVLS